MKTHWIVVTALLVIVTVVAFLNGLDGEFVLDDRPFLVDNPKIVETHSLSYFFTQHVWYYSNLGDIQSANFRPLYFLTLWLGNQLWSSSPLAFHLFSLMLHVSATLMLLVVIRRLIPEISVMAAGLAATLFSLHPVHSEAVAWISAFVHPLAAVFLLSAWLLHERARKKGKIVSTFIAAFFFVLALLSHEMAIAFPVFILLHDWLRYGRPHVLANAPYIFLLVAYLLVRNAVLGETIPMVFSDPEMWARFPMFVLEYLRQLILPWPQPLFLQMPEEWVVSLAAIIVVPACVAAGIRLGRIPEVDRRVPLIALAWVGAFLLPPLAAAFSPDARFALRSLYIASAGISLLLAWAIHNLPVMRRPVGIGVLGALLLLALGGTVVANRQWADDGKVYTRILSWNPEYYPALFSLGEFNERKGDPVQALDQYEKAASLAEGEDKAVPLERMATILGKAGDNERSLELFRQVTQLEPDNAVAWIGIGNNLWTLSKPAEAVDAYRKAYKVDPSRWKACYNLVLLLNQLGRTDEAAQYQACAQQPR
jgi:tetratricopeptide (TPR) repeat protein